MHSAGNSMLCKTCASFNWKTLLEFTSSDDLFILHERFRSVIKPVRFSVRTTMADCKFCALIALKYERSVRKHSVHASVETEDAIRANVEQTRLYHLDCPLAIQACRDPGRSATFSELKVFLVKQEYERSNSYDSRVAQHFDTKGPISTLIVDTITAIPNFSATFGVYKPQNSKHHSDLQIRPLVKLDVDYIDLGSRRLAFVREELRKCWSGVGHGACRSNKSKSPMPTRVLDCRELRLVETHDELSVKHGLSAPYAILSHCWGERPGIKTTRANCEGLCHSIELQQIPATIRDAISFVNKLGMRYLWVDSFCVIQSRHLGVEKEDMDWKRELPNMHRYYQNAAVTLVIESAEGDHEGFMASLNIEDETKMSSRPDLVRLSLSTLTYGEQPFYAAFASKLEILADSDTFFARVTPLRQRAWTLQEVILSPRKIHISGNEMVWSCASFALHAGVLQRRPIKPSSSQRQIRPIETRYTSRYGVSQDVRPMTWAEKVAEVSKSGISPTSFQRELRLQQWYEYVADYQQRKVTFPSDKLPAISAVAFDMALHLKFRYYAGIWIEDAPRGLAWRTLGFGISLASWRAPSWSWASLDLSTSLIPSHEDDIKCTYEADKFSLTICTIPTNFGTQYLLQAPTALEVEAHILCLDRWPQGWQMKIRTRAGPDDSWARFEDMSSKRQTKVPQNERLQCEFDCLRACHTYCPEDLADVVLLRLGTWVWTNRYTSHQTTYALMVRISDEGSYTRIGFAEVPSEGDWWEKGWERTRLTLV